MWNLIDELKIFSYEKRNRSDTFLFAKDSQFVIEDWIQIYFVILANIKRQLKSIIPAGHRNLTR